MGIGGVISGVITTLLGVGGILAVYGAAGSPIPLAPLVSFLGFGLTVLLFVAITIVGLIVIGEGLTEDEVVVARPVVVEEEPVTTSAVLSDVDVSILLKVSEGKRDGTIAQEAGVPKRMVREKIGLLHSWGYLTRDRRLTEKGYQVLAPTREIVVTNPAPS